ncbi:hypothetical protein C9374_009518 [Naegleria lovaniensis]|uniref:Uncharacterized protein n=1 Tax=Naegleria lovaniensis TaxID=51637 RepID=A0AA88H2Z4_NAELO|nr:uncharacterized protein C9374_009518 [Naegleria lovaniensis]KAG2392941.1 hypothetical protein C9374_009518 [Naegleria lovaniensis]
MVHSSSSAKEPYSMASFVQQCFKRKRDPKASDTHEEAPSMKCLVLASTHLKVADHQPAHGKPSTPNRNSNHQQTNNNNIHATPHRNNITTSTQENLQNLSPASAILEMDVFENWTFSNGSSERSSQNSENIVYDDHYFKRVKAKVEKRMKKALVIKKQREENLKSTQELKDLENKLKASASGENISMEEDQILMGLKELQGSNSEVNVKKLYARLNRKDYSNFVSSLEHQMNCTEFDRFHVFNFGSYFERKIILEAKIKPSCDMDVMKRNLKTLEDSIEYSCKILQAPSVKDIILHFAPFSVKEYIKLFEECGIHITTSADLEMQSFTFKLPEETILLSKIITEKFGNYISVLFKKFLNDMNNSVRRLSELELLLIAPFLIQVVFYKNHITACNLNGKLNRYHTSSANSILPTKYHKIYDREGILGRFDEMLFSQLFQKVFLKLSNAQIGDTIEEIMKRFALSTPNSKPSDLISDFSSDLVLKYLNTYFPCHFFKRLMTRFWAIYPFQIQCMFHKFLLLLLVNCTNNRNVSTSRVLGMNGTESEASPQLLHTIIHDSLVFIERMIDNIISSNAYPCTYYLMKVMDLIALSIGPKRFKFYEKHVRDTITKEQTTTYQNILSSCRKKIRDCPSISIAERQELIHTHLDSISNLLVSSTMKVSENETDQYFMVQ